MTERVQNVLKLSEDRFTELEQNFRRDGSSGFPTGMIGWTMDFIKFMYERLYFMPDPAIFEGEDFCPSIKWHHRGLSESWTLDLYEDLGKMQIWQTTDKDSRLIYDGVPNFQVAVEFLREFNRDIIGDYVKKTVLNG